MAGNLASQRVLAKLGLRLLKRRKAMDGKPLIYFGIDNPSDGRDGEDIGK